jgi:hypothetical protein
MDPDFGWHLRMGQTILERGVPETDQFSYTMPSYPYVDHEWLADVVVAKIYPIVGNKWLAAIDAGLVLLAIVVSLFQFPVRSNHLLGQTLAAMVVLLLGAAALFFYARVRFLVVTWVFFSILLWLIFTQRMRTRWRWVVPSLFVLWANLHGGYMAGLWVLGFYVTVRSVQERRVLTPELGILFLSLLASLLNPYGLRIWGEVWSSVTDVRLWQRVQEWMPAFYFINPGLPVFLAFTGVILVRYRHRIIAEQWIFLFWLIAGFWSQRHMPLFLLSVLPLVRRATGYMVEEVVSSSRSQFRLLAGLFAMLLIATGVFAFQVSYVFRQARFVSEEQFYPRKAVHFLRANPSSGEIFSRYDWGGYLLWKLPEKLVFLDGRMPSWRWEAPSLSESDSAFDEANALVWAEADFTVVSEKYGINTVLWSARPEREQDFLYRLVNSGWLEMYRDEVAVVYRKPL